VFPSSQLSSKLPIIYMLVPRDIVGLYLRVVYEYTPGLFFINIEGQCPESSIVPFKFRKFEGLLCPRRSVVTKIRMNEDE
jgi:hypothetical protein